MKIDTRGLLCPEPVLLTKKALASNPESLEILADNTTARNNIERFLKSSKVSSYDIQDQQGEFVIKVSLK